MIELDPNLRRRFDDAAARCAANIEAMEAALQDRRPPGASERRFVEASKEVQLLLAEAESKHGTPSVRARGRIWHLARIGRDVVLVSIREDQIAE